MSRYVTLALSCAVAAAAAAQDASVMKRLVADAATPIVTVRHVYKAQMGMMGQTSDSEETTETSGVVVTPGGLVVCSNTNLQGMMRRFSRMSSDVDVSITPVETKVQFAGDTKFYDARLVAHDEDRDLAWVTIDDPGDKTFPHVDFSGDAKADIGDRVYGVLRLAKFYDRAPVAVTTTIGAAIKRPRALYVPQDDLEGLMGLPVYTEGGAALGLVVLQGPNADDIEGGGGMMAMMDEMNSFQALILPSADLRKAMSLAQGMIGDATP